LGFHAKGLAIHAKAEDFPKMDIAFGRWYVHCALLRVCEIGGR
jgi:hypothetical protein